MYIIDTNRDLDCIEREIYSITLNELKWLITELSIIMSKINSSCKGITILELQRTVQLVVLRIGYLTLPLVRHISE